MNPPDCPEGFKPLFRTSPFLDATGPYFYKPLEEGFIVGLRVGAKHLNTSGTAHGGLLATLADVALGYVTAMSQQPPVRMTTTNLGLDYVGVAHEGDWLQAHVSVVKLGSRLAFANALIAANEAPVATARATFLVIGSAP
ncbi:PaaI family thioesterase [Vandammella animalimorsus]|uniref:PaaI family thioesterase n=1 Tax=Vandammella animalimorsus TaxID=2029117 RepID=A0A3M6RIR3_9BURK|nr:PaaI family thioesterase [Vandammella animalimorsus]RMX15003.1 PaaI family thioesterase [Vandammella animalimorsus]